MSSRVRPRVLLADDHVGLLKAWGRLLEPSYDVVGSVRDGRALLEAAVALKPDVIVADLAMPEVGGLEVCRMIKASLPQIKVVLVTGGGDENVARAAFRAGASAFVLKYAAARDLQVAIERALAGDEYCTPTVRMKSVEPTR